LLAAAGEAELARNIARRARRTIVVADHNKFGQGAPMIAYDPADVDTVITDTHLRPVFADFLKKWEIELLIAGDEGAQ
jgi:DeoR/GlpR family transcriptional regulator of sugar metabolism